MEYSKTTENQLDIMAEALDLINAAKAETYSLTFENALEIIKIDSLRRLENKMDMCEPNSNLDTMCCLLEDIVHNTNGIAPLNIRYEKRTNR